MGTINTRRTAFIWGIIGAFLTLTVCNSLVWMVSLSLTLLDTVVLIAQFSPIALALGISSALLAPLVLPNKSDGLSFFSSIAATGVAYVLTAELISRFYGTITFPLTVHVTLMLALVIASQSVTFIILSGILRVRSSGSSCGRMDEELGAEEVAGQGALRVMSGRSGHCGVGLNRQTAVFPTASGPEETRATQLPVSRITLVLLDALNRAQKSGFALPYESAIR